VTAAAAGLGLIAMPRQVFSAPDFSTTFFKVDLWGALKPALIPAVISLMFTDLFDSISTFIGVSQAAGMVDKNGQMPRMKEGLLVDAFATLTAGLFGTSSGTAYIESSAGIEMGGRTGLTAVFTALCFLPCLFIGPLAGMVPPYATAPVLILVGALMFRGVGELPMERLEDAIPTYLTIVLIPLTFSITQGILWGFIAHTLLYALVGRGREVSKTMYAISVLSIVLLWMEHT
jgi:AGZA family xanthine/uracil permease-like MFS transporter